MKLKDVVQGKFEVWKQVEWALRLKRGHLVREELALWLLG
jgi:hypothetical protein